MSEIIICFIFFTVIVLYCNYRIIRLEKIFIGNQKLQDNITKNTVIALTELTDLAEKLHQRITELEKNKIMNYGSRN